LFANPENEILSTTGITREYLTTLAVPEYANQCKSSILKITRREY